MKEDELPLSAKKQLESYRKSALISEKWGRQSDHEDRGSELCCRRKGGIKLLENRRQTLAELQKEYEINSEMEVICNTEKLDKVKARDLFKVARSAGHFGLFCSCGVVRAMEIFYLDESLSQVWGFLVRLVRDFPSQFEPCDKYFIGYDSACKLKTYCDNQAQRYPNSNIAKIISEIKKVHDRFHIQNHREQCRNGELNPDKYEILKGVNTEVAEQFFSHLLKFVCTFRNTNAIRAPIWILLIIHQWNLKKEAKLNNSLPNAQQLVSNPKLNQEKKFYSCRRLLSNKSKNRFNLLVDECRAKLLKPWSLEGMEVQQRAVQRRFNKRKRKRP